MLERRSRALVTFVLCTVALVATSTCRPIASEADRVDPEDTISTVRTAVVAFAQAERDRDVAAALAFIDPNFTMVVD